MLLISLRVLCVAAMCVLTSGQRVFFECGAKLDAADRQGLILSPGFPQNYLSGSHCVWLFFVPVAHQLTMEVFDFDIFESSERNWSSATIRSEEAEDDLLTTGFTRSRTFLQEPGGDLDETLWNTTQRVSKREHDDSTAPPSHSSTPSVDSEDESDTLPLLKEACPGDVLYITDLSSFSSRFCGSRRPSDQLLFGSDAKTVEVLMELITNTHRGRGFALMFRYRNQTSGAAGEVGSLRSSVPSVGAVKALLAAVSLAALFTTSLIIALCVTRRLKLCVKESNMTSSISSEVPVQNLHTDGSELQLVTKNHPEQELNKNNTSPLPHTGNVPECHGFQNAALECSTGLTEMELAVDEVFISNPDISFSSCTVDLGRVPLHVYTKLIEEQHCCHSHTRSRQRGSVNITKQWHCDRILHRSDTVSMQPSDWMLRSEPPNWQSRGGHVGSPRPRAWSVRTIQDFLLPFPQLNRKWCSWNLTSPFTKLVDTVSPGLVMDAVDAAKVPSAQHQHCSPSRTSQQHCAPDGTLCGPEQEVELKFITADDDLSIPVFAISEVDDREPLVSAEHQKQMKHGEIRNHESFPSLSSAHSAFMDEESADLKNTSRKIQIPSLSHVIAPCDSVGTDV